MGALGRVSVAPARGAAGAVALVIVRSFALVLLLLLAGCAPETIPNATKIGKLGIVTAVPETAGLYHGLLSGGTETVPVDWGFNDAAETTLLAMLGQHHGAATIRKGASPAFVKQLRDMPGGQAGDEVAKLVQPGQYDAILLVTADAGCTANREFLVVFWTLTVLDGRTMQVRASKILEVKGTNIWGIDNAWRSLDFRLQPWDRMPEDVRRHFGVLAIATMKQGFAFSLPRLGFQVTPQKFEFFGGVTD